MPQAVFWDLDGTLIDSEPYWAVVEKDLLARAGKPWNPPVAGELQGTSLADVAQFMIDSGLENMSADEIIDLMVSQVYRMEVDNLPWTQGAVGVLAMLRDAGIPCVLVTSSPRNMAQNAVDQAPEGTFVDLVCADDPVPHKPNPAPYLRAAEKIGVDITKCLIFEDSKPGLTAARACGARVVAITGYSRINSRELGLADEYIENYDGISLEFIANVMK